MSAQNFRIPPPLRALVLLVGLGLALATTTRPSDAQVFLGIPQPSSPAGTITSSQPTFTWTAAPRASGADSDTRYEIFLWNSFSGEVSQPSGIFGLSFPYPAALGLGVPYQWWVRAVDVTTGEISPWGGPATFSLPPDGPPVPVFPVGQVADTGNGPAVTWTYSGAIPNPTFDLLIANPVNNQQFHLNGVASGVQAPAGLLAGGYCYRWWVRAHNPVNAGTSDWSAPADFCFALDGGAIPLPLTPSGPVGDTLGGPYTPTFTWSYPAAHESTRYDLYIAGMGTAVEIVKHGLTGTSYTLAGGSESLGSDSYVLFWVRATDSVTGGHGDWSPSRMFNTLDVPTVLAIDGTATGPTESSAQPTFLFTHPNYLNLYPIVYDFYIYNPATGQLYNSQQVAGSALDATTRQWTVPDPLPAGYTYTFYMRMRNPLFAAEGAWSQAAVLGLPLYGDEAPGLLGPFGTLTTLDPTFEWSFSGGTSATRFDLYLYDRSNGQLTYFDQTPGAATGYSAQDLGITLTDGHDYEWWTRSRDSAQGGAGPWSSSGTFTVALP